MDWINIVAERKIQEAIEAGEFNDLPDKGRPIDLEEDMSIPAHQRIAARLLKNARALPEWMQAEKDIARESESIAGIKERGLRGIAHAKTADLRGRIAVRLRREIRERMDLVNTLILKYNFVAPSGYQKTFVPFRIAPEMDRLEREIEEVSRP